MAQDTLVREQIEGGQELITELAANGFDVTVAFWAKESDSGLWSLFLASPAIDQIGLAKAYQTVHTAVRRMPDRRIDPFEIKLVRASEPIAHDALRVMTPVAPDSQFAVQPPPYYRTPTYYNGASLGGIGIDGAYIYPPTHPAPAA